MPEDSLHFYKQLGESLAKAEVRPESMLEQKHASMAEYNSMAFNYEDQGDYVTASYFYRKVIDIALGCKVTLADSGQAVRTGGSAGLGQMLRPGEREGTSD